MVRRPRDVRGHLEAGVKVTRPNLHEAVSLGLPGHDDPRKLMEWYVKERIEMIVTEMETRILLRMLSGDYARDINLFDRFIVGFAESDVWEALVWRFQQDSPPVPFLSYFSLFF